MTAPLLSRTLDGLPYPVLRVVIGGCRLVMNAPLPAGQPLTVRASLVGVEDKGRHVVLHQRVVTGPAARPESLTADIYAIIPLPPGGGTNGKNGTHGANSVSTEGIEPRPEDLLERIGESHPTDRFTDQRQLFDRQRIPVGPFDR